MEPSPQPQAAIQKTMLWEGPTFPFTRYLEANFAAIRDEAQRLAVEDYDDWPQKYGFTGSWKIYGFYSRDPSWHLAATCPAHALRCPDTVRIVRRIQGIARAGYSMLMPGTHVSPHTDGQTGGEDLLRCHMGLMCNDKSGMRVAGQQIHWGPGRSLVFDGQAEHEAANFGATPRVILLLDVDRATIESPVLHERHA